MAERILVTGGTGFTGCRLTQSLLRQGHHVRVLTRSVERAPAEIREAELLEGDISDPGTVAALVSGCDRVFHLAAAYREAGIPDRRYWEVHVRGTELLLQAAQAEGVRRFVHTSTVGVLSHIENPPADETWPHRPGDIYQATKSEGEQLALAFQEQHSLPVTVARPTAIYGPGDMRLLRLFRLVAKRRFVMLGSGQIYYHMVHVDDLVRGLELLSEHPAAPGEVFILGGDGYRSLWEIVELIAKAVDAPMPRLQVPAWPVQLAGSLCERICIPLGIEPPIYRRRVDFFTKSRAFTIEKARTRLGYTPEISLEAGIRDTAKSYAEQGLL